MKFSCEMFSAALLLSFLKLTEATTSPEPIQKNELQQSFLTDLTSPLKVRRRTRIPTSTLYHLPTINESLTTNNILKPSQNDLIDPRMPAPTRQNLPKRDPSIPSIHNLASQLESEPRYTNRASRALARKDATWYKELTRNTDAVDTVDVSTIESGLIEAKMHEWSMTPNSCLKLFAAVLMYFICSIAGMNLR
jgi:hypothetical protein